MFFQTIYTPSLSLNTYLIGSLEANCCAVIDPCRQIAPIIAATQSSGLTITHIIETHVHADFISGALELKQELNQTPLICCSAMGGKEWRCQYADQLVHEADSFHFGSIKLKALHTPGHSPEHLSYLCYDELRNKEVPWLLFTGDFLFVDGVGRPDLIEKEDKNSLSQLYDSLHTKLNSLPDFIEIFPAHTKGSICGPSYTGKSFSTLGYERCCNPFFQNKDLSQWSQLISQTLSSYPPHLKKVKQLNLKGVELLENLTALSSEGSLDAIELEEFFIIDTRSAQKFAAFHLPGSINIAMHDHFSQWCQWFVPFDAPLAIVTEDHYRDAQITSQLRLVGFDQPLFYIALSSRLQSHLEGKNLALIRPEELVKTKAKIIDVRSIQEWKQGHLSIAEHIELAKLTEKTELLSKNEPIVFMCRSGTRAAIAASFLQKKGFEKVAALQGSLDSCMAAGLTIEKS